MTSSKQIERTTMDTTCLRRVRRMFNSEYVTREVNRANQREWVRSMRVLGDKWLLAKPVPRVPRAPSVLSTHAEGAALTPEQFVRLMAEGA